VADRPTTRGLGTRSAAAALMALLALAFGATLALFSPEKPIVDACPAGSGPECRQFGGVGGFSHELVRSGVVPFELISMLLTVAIIGAIAVARGRTAAEVADTKRRRLEHDQRTGRAELEAGAPAGGE
jgi:NADH:ubiquinone oxidoreductase subunit 6 (subunit J)